MTTSPFCPDQTDFLCFRSPDGFAAVEFNLIEGFVAFETDEMPKRYLTRINLTNNNFYDSTETVPELVSRCAEIKRRRYSIERGETELIKTNPLTPVGPYMAGSGKTATTATEARAGSIWKKPGEPGSQS